MKRFLAAAGLGLLAFFVAWSGPAKSQASVVTNETVVSGGAGVVARDAKIEVTVNPKRGNLTKITEPSSDDVLLYYAAKTDGEYEDELRYKNAAGAEKVVRIVVRKAPTLAEGATYTKSFKALFALFILAVLVKSALAVLFRWRPYLNSVNSRGANALIAVGVSAILVFTFQLDITTRLVNLYTGSNFSIGFMGMLLTAFIIAGGSAGVNTLFRSLGFREIVRPEAEEQKPPPTKAWLAVIHKKGDTAGPVDVVIVEDEKELVARSIKPSIGNGWFARNFRRDPGRFPAGGGHVLTPGNGDTPSTCERSTIKDDERLILRSETWGPTAVTAGGIIDLELTPREVERQPINPNPAAPVTQNPAPPVTQNPAPPVTQNPGPGGHPEPGPAGYSETGRTGHSETGPTCHSETGPAGHPEPGPAGHSETGPAGHSGPGPAGQSEFD